MAAAVVAVAASKIPLVIWIEVVGVESGKGGRIGTGMADPIVKVVDAAINPVEFLLDIDVHARSWLTLTASVGAVPGATL